jgi:hypothetical protein
MLRIRGKYSILISRSCDEVFKFVATDLFQNRRLWALEILELEKTSTGPVDVGTTWRERIQDRWGRQGEATYSVTEYKPSEAFAVEGMSIFIGSTDEVEGTPLNFTTRNTFQSAIGGAKVTFEYEYNSTINGVSKLTLFLWSIEIKRQNRARFGKLRSLLEAQD